VHASPFLNVLVPKGLAIAALLLVGLPGCGPSAPANPPCDDDSQCPDDRPVCVQTSPDEPGLCAATCSGDECGSGRACVDGACVVCLGGGRVVGAECTCASDCASGLCNEGRCGGECLVDGCEAGLVCEGNPAACRECLGVSDAPDGAGCGCNADCASGLECIGDLCGRPCDIDEQCGSDECFHSLRVPASCGPIDAACTFTGDVAAGGACVCNADCGFDAPLCVLAVVGGELRRSCSARCGPEQLCPSGTSCCTVDGLNDYCIDPTVASTLSAECR
jgi:hypothetical protein